MDFIAFRKLQNGFPVGQGDEVRKHLGREYVVSPNENQWRVFIFDGGQLVNTRRTATSIASHGYAQSYIEELRHAKR